MSLKSRGILMSKQIYGSVHSSNRYFLFTAPNDIGMNLNILYDDLKKWKYLISQAVLYKIKTMLGKCITVDSWRQRHF